ncbi:S1C family serine protease [Priestia megaterium]|uniref:S1C family serine protease n=1 Tax=Priestia megaterium TaxID=1404 RepID=UPI0035DCDDFC
MKHFYTKMGMLVALSLGTIIYSGNTLPTTATTKHLTQQSNRTSTNDIYEKAVPSVFAIYLESRTNKSSVSGTGFVIKAQNELLIVTNEHVVSSKKQVFYLINKSGEKYKGRVIYSNKDDDIAFLKLSQKPNIPGLEIDSNINKFSIGTSVYTIGNPYDFLFSMSNGIISNLNENVVFEDGDFDELLIQTTINVNPGNSGGPLLNGDGEVIGIVSSMLEDSNGMSFAVPAKTIEKNIKKLNGETF